MQGGYMPGFHRVKIAQQVRKTHFTLGEEGVAYTTAHSANFKPVSAPSPQDEGANNKKLRTSNLNLGAGQNPSNFKSEFTSQYRAHSLEPKHGLKDSFDMRAHNIILGKQEVSYSTTANVAFDDKCGLSHKQETTGISSNKANLRKHHFNLGDDPNASFSVMKSDYGQKQSESFNAGIRDEIKNNLRSSHFDLGKQSVPFVSSTQSEYKTKAFQPRSVTPGRINELRKEHFQLGNDQGTLVSINNLAFSAKSGGAQPLNQEKLNDLRSSHFVLGVTPISYLTATKAVHQPQEMIPSKPEKSTSVRQSHFKLGEDTPSYHTNYAINHSHTTRDATTGPERSQSADRNSNIILGTVNANAYTTSGGTYKGRNGEAGKLDPNLEKDLRGHHFQLGDNGLNYKTINQDYGEQKGYGTKWDPNRVKDMRSAHWAMGSHPKQFLPVSKADFSAKETSVERASMEAQLRRSHFELGEGRGEWNTSNQASYKWVQPVADTSYRFAIQTDS
ncbi:unnamed protein product [Blepharisma stoltei]|uniref:Uncharacterized protein n=1 Tax=Blepharisma stoltei TaxID=1481888 RepID=A0AAU9JG54_9CILI|nr:unnamed protein product [Blepharisma stoltei]